MSVYNRISDRTRPCETVWDRETVHFFENGFANRVQTVTNLAWSSISTHPQARLELNTRTSQPAYKRVYRIGTVCPTVFCVRQALNVMLKDTAT